MDFFHITREYRNEMKMTLKNARISDQINAITLQSKTQNQADQSDQNPESDHSLGSGHNHESGHCPDDHGDEKFKDRKCVCDEMHLFKKCSYIVTSARKPE
jgi:hypothetical protein